jgi:hypothetical protein
MKPKDITMIFQCVIEEGESLRTIRVHDRTNGEGLYIEEHYDCWPDGDFNEGERVYHAAAKALRCAIDEISTVRAESARLRAELAAIKAIKTSGAAMDEGQHGRVYIELCPAGCKVSDPLGSYLEANGIIKVTGEPADKEGAT